MRRTLLAMAAIAVAALAAPVGLLTIGAPPAQAAAPARAAAADQPAGWAWPLPPPHIVVQGFDPPSEPWLPGQRGVDLAGRAGETVLAAGSGVVRYAGRVAGMAVVSITHPSGLVTTYEPVRGSVRAGQQILRGQPIGRLVLGGSQCAPRACLHWGLRRGVDYLDPLALVAAAAVRLLPFGSSSTGTFGTAIATAAASSGAVTLSSLGILRRRRRYSAFGQITTR